MLWVGKRVARAGRFRCCPEGDRGRGSAGGRADGRAGGRAGNWGGGGRVAGGGGSVGK